jgi:hypothetical protein
MATLAGDLAPTEPLPTTECGAAGSCLPSEARRFNGDVGVQPRRRIAVNRLRSRFHHKQRQRPQEHGLAAAAFAETPAASAHDRGHCSSHSHQLLALRRTSFTVCRSRRTQRRAVTWAAHAPRPCGDRRGTGPGLGMGAAAAIRQGYCVGTPLGATASLAAAAIRRACLLAAGSGRLVWKDEIAAPCSSALGSEHGPVVCACRRREFAEPHCLVAWSCRCRGGRCCWK